MSSKIIVTGGCGFVGHPLTTALLELGHQVRVIDAMWFGNHLPDHENLEVIESDIRNLEESCFEGVETVFHLANVANDPCSDLNSKLNWEVNALASMQLVEMAIKKKVRQFVFASSGSVYGVKEEPLVTEELSLVPISDYNKTKMISERVLLSYADKILISCIRSGNGLRILAADEVGPFRQHAHDAGSDQSEDYGFRRKSNPSEHPYQGSGVSLPSLPGKP